MTLDQVIVVTYIHNNIKLPTRWESNFKFKKSFSTVYIHCNKANSEKSQVWIYSGSNSGLKSRFGKFGFVHCYIYLKPLAPFPDTQARKQALRNRNLIYISIIQQKLILVNVIQAINQNSDGFKVGMMVSTATDYSFHIEMYSSKPCQYISIYNDF